jgi:VanZ family protein
MRFSIKNLLYSWIPSVLITTLISILSVIRSNPPGLLFSASDLFKHFLAYMTLSIFMFFPFERIKSPSKRYLRSIMIVVICSIIGYGLENVQRLIPEREYDLLDAAANLIGSVTGQLFTYTFSDIYRERK